MEKWIQETVDHFGEIEGARVVRRATPAKNAITFAFLRLDEIIDPKKKSRVIVDYDPAFEAVLVRVIDV